MTSSFVIFHDYSIIQPTYPSPKGEGFADPLSGTLNARREEYRLAIIAALNHMHSNAWHDHPWPSRHGRTPLRRGLTP